MSDHDSELPIPKDGNPPLGDILSKRDERDELKSEESIHKNPKRVYNDNDERDSLIPTLTEREKTREIDNLSHLSHLSPHASSEREKEKRVIKAMVESCVNLDAIKQNDGWKPVDEIKIHHSTENRFLDEIPFIINNTTTVLYGQPNSGKTTLLIPIVKKFLEASEYHYVGYLSEAFNAMGGHVLETFKSDCHRRFLLQSVTMADEEWMTEQLTHFLEQFKRTVNQHKFLIVVDTLMPMLGAWGIDVASNTDTTRMLAFFKEWIQLWQENHQSIAALFLHHENKIRDGVKPEMMGAQSIRSQINTRVELVSDPVAQMTSVAWTSQVIDIGAMAFKFTESVTVGDRKIFTDYAIVDADDNMLERKQTRNELERQAQAAAYFIMINADEIPGRSSLGGLANAISCGHSKAKKLEEALVNDRILMPRAGYAEHRIHDDVAVHGDTTAERINYVREELFRLPPAAYHWDEQAQKLTVKYK